MFRHRSAYSLLEMLIVLAIMGILASLLMVSVFTSINAAEKRTTRLSLQKLEVLITAQVAANNRQADLLYPNTALCPAGTDPQVWRNSRRNREFPTSFLEAQMDPDPVPLYKQFWQANPSLPIKYQSSAMLLLALTQGEHATGEGISPDMIGYLNGVPFLRDGWGNPIAFCIATTPDNPNTHPYIQSAGPDGRFDTQDDLVRDAYDPKNNKPKRN